MKDRVLVALADPTKSLYDRETGWRISSDNVRELPTNPFPSERVKTWFQLGAIVEVDPADVMFFYSRKELNQMGKPEISAVAQDWGIPLELDGKAKSRAKLIEELVEVIGE